MDEHRRDLARAPGHEHQQEAREDHADRVEFGQPRDHDRRKSAVVADRCGDRMARAAD